MCMNDVCATIFHLEWPVSEPVPVWVWPIFCLEWPTVYVTCVLSEVTCVWMICKWHIFCLACHVYEWCVRDLRSVWCDMCMNDLYVTHILSVPTYFKIAVIKHLLKKPPLKCNELKNYRCILNLFENKKTKTKKVLWMGNWEKLWNTHVCVCVCACVETSVETCSSTCVNLLSIHQFAYRSWHSTETAYPTTFSGPSMISLARASCLIKKWVIILDNCNFLLAGYFQQVRNAAIELALIFRRDTPDLFLSNCTGSP